MKTKQENKGCGKELGNCKCGIYCDMCKETHYCEECQKKKNNLGKIGRAIKMEKEIKARIRNQLRIHWFWLKKKEDYNEIADLIYCWIKQALSKSKKESKK